ncbi:MAG: Uma2 family endonuclease [Oscillospiraceae bacterium]
MPLRQEDQTYTYADYSTWDDSERWELIEGLPYAMSPAPAPKHQEISFALSLQLGNFLKGKPCKLYPAPFDVRLNADREDDTVVQPDLSVICDSAKIDDKGCKGAPDFVVEILSPSTARRDRMVKFQLYLQAGVREYWIVDPDTQTVQVCILCEGFYRAAMYGDTDKISVSTLPGCEIDLQDVFPSQE